MTPAALSALSDEALVARCRTGDRSAWRELVDRYSGYVWSIAVRAYRLSEADAEDVFQDVFTRAYQRLGDLRADGALRPWLAQLTRRLCVDRLRASARETPEDAIVDEPAADAALERLAEALTVRQALSALPDHCRDVLDRFFACDESYETIGAALAIPPGTIASRISRCLGKLRAVLEPATAGGAG